MSGPAPAASANSSMVPAVFMVGLDLGTSPRMEMKEHQSNQQTKFQSLSKNETSSIVSKPTKSKP